MREETGPYLSPNLKEFNHINKEYNDIYHEAIVRMGLSESAFDILYSVCELGDGCLQRDICKVCYIPKQTVNSAVRKLEKAGYLVLTRGHGRQMHISLTEMGNKMLQQWIYPLIQSENEAFSALTEEETTQLLSLHRKYVKALRTSVLDGIQKE